MAPQANVTNELPLLVPTLPQLPQELVDEILSLTFALWTLSFSRKHVEISSGYSPPPLLHFNRATRESFAMEYYVNTVFHCRSESLLIKWLLSLPNEHVSLLRRVRYTGPLSHVEDPKLSETKACETFRQKVVDRLRKGDVQVEDGKFLTVWS